MAGELTIEEYDRLELDGIANSPNLAIEAFQPHQFQSTGFPTRIRRESELWKYVNLNSALEFESNFDNVLGGLTPEEFELLKIHTSDIAQFTEERLGQRMISRSNVINSINVLRHIKYIFGDARPRVFEIGPGNGNLAAILFSQGYPYAGTDLSQAFYLIQNRLWNYLTDGKIRELALSAEGEEDWSAPECGQPVHGPWWKFLRLDPDSTPRYDVLTCNDVLREMHEHSLGFNLRVASNLLKPEETPKVVVFRGWGGGFLPSDGYVAEIFYRLGFVLVHHDYWISVLTPANTPFASDHLELPRSEGKIKSFTLSSLRRLASAPARTFAGFEPIVYSSIRNPLSRSINEGRESQRSLRTVGSAEVVEFYKELLGREDLSTADERFLILSRVDRARAHTPLQ